MGKNNNPIDSETTKNNFPETVEECWQIIGEQENYLQEHKKEITELADLKGKLEKQLKQLRSFYQYAPSFYLVLNKEGRIQDVNKNAADFMGFEVSALKNRMFYDFLVTSSVPDFNSFLSDLFKTNKKKSKTFILKPKNEVQHNVQLEGLALPNETVCILDIGNVSERTNVFDQLGECRVGCRSVLDDLNEGIVIQNLEGIFTYVNQAAEIIFGAAGGELKNRTLNEFLNGGLSKPLQSKKDHQQQVNQSRYELEIVTFQGIVKTLSISEAPYYNWKGQLTGTINMFTDVTLQRNHKNEIEKRLELELIISEISTNFVHLKQENLNASVNKAIKEIGSFAGVDRSYIFLFSEDSIYCSNTHEWCKAGIEPQIENLQEVPVEIIPWWMDKLSQFETVHIPLVSDLPIEAQGEKEILEAQDIQSVLVIPLLTSNKLIGFIGFDSVAEIKDWKDEDIMLLNMLGEILGNGFGRMKYEDELVRVNAQLEQKVEERTYDIIKLMELNKAIVNNVDLIVMSTGPNGIITSINPYAEKMLGYQSSEIIGKYTALFFHDPEFVFNKTGKVISKKEIGTHNQFDLFSWQERNGNNNNEWVFVTKDGQKIDVLLTASKLKDEKGEITGFACIAMDITERKQNEMYGILSRDLGFALAATTSIEKALEQVIQVASKVDAVSRAGIYMINFETEELELVYHYGFHDESIKAVREYSKDSVQYKIVQQGKPVYGKYTDLIPSKADMLFHEEQMVGIIPVKYEGKVIGNLNIVLEAGIDFSIPAKIILESTSAQIGGTLTRINSENALKFSQRNFQLMFETIDDFVFILDSEGKIVKTNAVVEKRLAYSKEELLGMSVLEVHTPERRDEAAFIVGEMLAGRKDICPVPLFAKDGVHIPVETKVVLGRWDSQDAIYGISRDITERIKAEETLRKSEQRWNFALEGSGDGVWDWNIATNEVFLSKQWKRMLGYNPAEIENDLKEWEKRVHPDDLSNCYADLEKHINGETDVYSNEHRLKCKDGSYIWILDRGKIVEQTPDGRAGRIIGVHTDITHLKQMEEQLLRTIEKEKELNELKSRFVSTASHEFRTPLASIMMVSETLISYQNKMDAPQIAARLTKIKEHVIHLTTIVNDVLHLSRIQEGKIEFNPKLEDMVALCSSVIDDFNTTIMTDGQIEFKTRLKDLLVQVDHRIITQVITNILSNAIKYSLKNPEISVELAQTKQEWTIVVKDNGIGIPEADQKHLFKPFFRAGNVSAIQGNGLGLNIVYESVIMHGGNIKVLSNESEGSVFRLCFPANFDSKK